MGACSVDRIRSCSTSIFCTEICCLHFAYLFLVCIVQNNVHTSSKLVRFSLSESPSRLGEYRSKHIDVCEIKVARYRYLVLGFRHGENTGH